MKELLRRFARRCDTHDVSSPVKIRRLEAELGMELSQPTGDFVADHADPDIIDCRKPWCRTRRA
ncbi:hypothetical protein [Streptomyces sp. NPDC002328]|uniref:hypothetical protein n=1 Tax=Streptomyces sp. NPDC002328 TaxID=3364642 RepID=UPI0036B42A03